MFIWSSSIALYSRLITPIRLGHFNRTVQTDSAFLGGIQPTHIASTSSKHAEAARLSDKAILFLLSKMEPPLAPDTCCGSGCAICVWDTYSDDYEEFTESRVALRTELTTRLEARGETYDPKIEKQLPGKSEMDPQLKAFIEMEKRLADNQSG